MEMINLDNIKIPSVNNKYYKNFSLKPEYREFKKILFTNCRNIKIDPPYKVTIYFSAYIDIDNPVKPILDALEDRGAIDNDKNVHELQVFKMPIKRGKLGQVVVDIETIN